MIKIKNISFSYGNELIIDHLDLEIQHSDILTIVGPTGCGKSTLLRLIAGLEKPKEGEIIIQQSRREKRSFRFLFQDYDAFPWFTTWENVKKSSNRNHYPSDEMVETILKRVGLFESRSKYPNELSGGMRKRLALARCLVADTSLLLLDEPFSKLDVDTRGEMYALLQELQREFNQTIIFVTHDLHEAILLGSKILVSSHLPFRVHEFIDVPFEYPRSDSIVNFDEYWRILQNIRSALHPVNEQLSSHERVT
jgi:ABC-type nitrate/sulfonate/bicarbonate transport system ATPase subunit